MFCKHANIFNPLLKIALLLQTWLVEGDWTPPPPVISASTYSMGLKLGPVIVFDERR